MGLVFYRTFEHGIAPAWNAVTTPDAMHAFWLTLEIAAIAVPLNTVFGVVCALLLARRQFRGRWLLNALVDLPFAVSPVVVGLALVLVYGRTGWFGDWLADHGIRVIFSMPGMILATIFVSLPFVVREVVPVLRELGTDQEQAAATLGASPWQTFWRITLPAIRWGVGYGVVLTDGAGAGRVRRRQRGVRASLAGQTETLTLRVRTSSRTSTSPAPTRRRRCSRCSRSPCSVDDAARAKERAPMMHRGRADIEALRRLHRAGRRVAGGARRARSPRCSGRAAAASPRCCG